MKSLFRNGILPNEVPWGWMLPLPQKQKSKVLFGGSTSHDCFMPSHPLHLQPYTEEVRDKMFLKIVLVLGQP